MAAPTAATTPPAAFGVPAAAAAPSCCEADADACWICLDGAREGLPLVAPCQCPRLVHRACLAKWQLTSAGKNEETRCRFCDRALPDWRPALTPGALKPAASVMSVRYRGVTHRITYTPGPDGLEQFLDKLRAIGIKVASASQVTFLCRSPDSGEEMALKGLGAFDAAAYCASITAAKRLARKELRARQQQEAQAQAQARRQEHEPAAPPESAESAAAREAALAGLAALREQHQQRQNQLNHNHNHPYQPRSPRVSTASTSSAAAQAAVADEDDCDEDGGGGGGRRSLCGARRSSSSSSSVGGAGLGAAGGESWPDFGEGERDGGDGDGGVYGASRLSLADGALRAAVRNGTAHVQDPRLAPRGPPTYYGVPDEDPLEEAFEGVRGVASRVQEAAATAGPADFRSFPPGPLSPSPPPPPASPPRPQASSRGPASSAGDSSAAGDDLGAGNPLQRLARGLCLAVMSMRRW